MFDHFINKIKFSSVVRLVLKPCAFIEKILGFFKISSVMLNEVNEILQHTYQIQSLTENDFEAVIARIWYIQNHETQMRTTS